MKDVHELEVYSPIDDFPDYLVTSHGRVFSLKYNKMKELKQRKNNWGYYYVNLLKNGKQYTKTVHRLVAQAFILNPDNKPQVNHIDENTKNNNVNNLEWVTHSQNIKHSAYRQSYPVAQYDKNYNLIAKYESVAEASRQTGYARSNIKSAIERNGTCHGYIWKYL